MAADSHDRDDGRHVPTQEEYERQASEESWVDLIHADGSFKIREIAPLKVLRGMKNSGLLELSRAIQQADDEDDVDVDFEEMVYDGRFEQFLEDLVLPGIVEPNCYWRRDGVEDIGDGNFDLASLHPEDFFHVVQGLSGREDMDPEDVLDGDGGNPFQFDPPGDRSASDR